MKEIVVVVVAAAAVIIIIVINKPEKNCSKQTRQQITPTQSVL
jgi:hypothetical protein